MDNALVRFVGTAPKDVIELICNYLEFNEFLALTSVSRYMRSVLVNEHLFWTNYYVKRLNFRQYEEPEDLNEKGTNKYELRMPSFEKKQPKTDPANRLLNSARKVEIMRTDNAFSSNPMLNLSILDNFKRSRWKGEFKQYTEKLSKFTTPTIVVPTLGMNPFLVISNTNVCGFNVNEDKFMFNNFVTPIDCKRYEIKLCSWVRFDDVSYTEKGQFNSLTSRVNYVPKILVIVYGTDMNSLAISFYLYNEDTAFVNMPTMMIKMEIESDDNVSAMDVYGSLGTWDGREISFKYLNIFVGTINGKIIQKRMEDEFVFVDRKESVTCYEITSIRYVQCQNKSVLIVFSSGNYLGIIDISNDCWNVIEDINDTVVTYSIDTADSLMAYSTSFQNRTTFVDIYNFFTEKIHYLVPKPPFCILSLERDSKWAIVIRNYIRVLQVIHPNQKTSRSSSRSDISKYHETIANEDNNSNSNNSNNSNSNSNSNNNNSNNSSNSNNNNSNNNNNNKNLSEMETYREKSRDRLMSEERGEESHQKLKFKSICTLNGHHHEITHCVHDGWSKLVTIDSFHSLFVWDYTIGCKIFSFSLVNNINKNFSQLQYFNLTDFEGKNKRTNFKHLECRSTSKLENVDSSQCNYSRREGENTYRRDPESVYSKRELDFKRSVNMINRMVTKSEMKDAIQDLLYFNESDIDRSPMSDTFEKQTQKTNKSKNFVPASNIKGLLDPNKKGQKYHVDVSVQSLIVYYKSCNIVQVWSFK